MNGNSWHTGFVGQLISVPAMISTGERWWRSVTDSQHSAAPPEALYGIVSVQMVHDRTRSFYLCGDV